MRNPTTTGLLAALAVAATLTGGCLPASGSSADGRGARIIEGTPTTTEPQPEQQQEEGGEGDTAAVGTRHNPLPAGTTIALADWDLSVTTDTDATAEIVAASRVNSIPDGHVAVIATLDVTYTGDDSATPAFELRIRWYGPGGNTYDDYCGLYERDLRDVGEMFPGASATGRHCTVVPADQVNGGAWIIEPLFDFTRNERVFIAAE